jgi:uncharacterized protein (TIGR02452 family)
LNQKQEKIDISAVQQKALQNSTLYKEEEFEALILKRNQLFNTQPTFQTHFEVLPNTTLECCFKLSKTQNKIFCLNFASARNEGGGFLNGAKAQEESLARSSGLYPCLTKFHYEFYQMHRDFKSTYYTSNMIFSPNVPIFKNDDGDLLDNFYEISFLTSPAVNVGSLKTQGNFKQEKYEKIMLERMEFLLTIAYLEKYEDLVLGALGAVGLLAMTLCK